MKLIKKQIDEHTRLVYSFRLLSFKKVIKLQEWKIKTKSWKTVAWTDPDNHNVATTKAEIIRYLYWKKENAKTRNIIVGRIFGRIKKVKLKKNHILRDYLIWLNEKEHIV